MSDNVIELRPGETLPIHIAADELLKAVGVLEVVYDVYAMGGDDLKESVTENMSATLYCVLDHIRRAQECVNSVPHQ